MVEGLDPATVQAQEPLYPEVQVGVLDNRAGIRASARKMYAAYSSFIVRD